MVQMTQTGDMVSVTVVGSSDDDLDTVANYAHS